MKKVTKIPAWKEALDNFTFCYGDVIPHKWFYVHFGLKEPTATTRYGESKESAMLFMANFKRLEDALLEERQMALRNIRGEGWEVVTPNEQTDWAMHTGTHEMKKALRKMYSRQMNVNHSMLTIEEKKENADSLARTSMLNSMLGRFKRKQLTSE